MGADFCFMILPICKMTPERVAQARSLINDDPDGGAEREDVLGYLDKYINGDYHNDRTVGHTHFDGVEYHVTGGLSWGDPPTDKYDEFYHLDSQIGHLLMEWARKDTTFSTRSALTELLDTLDRSKQTDETCAAMDRASSILNTKSLY